MARSSLRVQPLGSPLPQYVYGRVAVDQFASFCLSEAFLDVGGEGFAFCEHPVFESELLADDRECLIEHLTGVLVRTRLDREIDDTLLFRFQVNRHRGSPTKPSCFSVNLPYSYPTASVNNFIVQVVSSTLVSRAAGLFEPSYGHICTACQRLRARRFIVA